VNSVRSSRPNERVWGRGRVVPRSNTRTTHNIHNSETHLEKLGCTSIDTDAFSLVEITFEVLLGYTFGVARVDESVEYVSDHVEFRHGHFDL
jgi:hypothetical protein